MSAVVIDLAPQIHVLQKGMLSLLWDLDADTPVIRYLGPDVLRTSHDR